MYLFVQRQPRFDVPKYENKKLNSFFFFIEKSKHVHVPRMKFLVRIREYELFDKASENIKQEPEVLFIEKQ